MVNDMSRAYFHAPREEEIYLEFRMKDQEPGEGKLC